jgi:hypothetical protein
MRVLTPRNPVRLPLHATPKEGQSLASNPLVSFWGAHAAAFFPG